MPYRVVATPAFRGDVNALRAVEQARIRAALSRYLEDQPDHESHIRRPLDPNPLGATWELRLGELRVFYDVDPAAQVVRVLRAGRKPGSTLYVGGRPFEMRLP